MAIQALNLHDFFDKTHPDDTENPTVWTIGIVDSRVLSQIQDKSTDISFDPSNPDAEAGVRVNQNEVALKVVQFGLKGFRNFANKEGEVQYDTERRMVGNTPYMVVKSDIIAVIPSDVLKWLADEIMDLNKVNAEEAKS